MSLKQASPAFISCIIALSVLFAFLPSLLSRDALASGDCVLSRQLCVDRSLDLTDFDSPIYFKLSDENNVLGRQTTFEIVKRFFDVIDETGKVIAADRSGKSDIVFFVGSTSDIRFIIDSFAESEIRKYFLRVGPNDASKNFSRWIQNPDRIDALCFVEHRDRGGNKRELLLIVLESEIGRCLEVFLKKKSKG